MPYNCSHFQMGLSVVKVKIERFRHPDLLR